MMQGDLNKSPRAPTQSNPHTQSHMHAHTHTLTNILTNIIYAGEKYINICITKQYKGLSVVKYLFCQIKTWRRIHVGCHFLMSTVCKTTSPFAFNKISFLIYEKYSHCLMGFEALDYIPVHKKSHPLKFVQQMKATSGELHDLDAIRG